MQVERAKLVKLLLLLGVDAAEGWSLPQLVAKVNQTPGGITRYKESDQTITDPELSKLYDDIVADQSAGNLTEVLGGDAPQAVAEPVAAPSFATPVTETEPAADAADGAEKPKKKAKKAAKKAKEPKAKKAAKPKRAASANGKKQYWPEGRTWAEQVAYWKKNPMEVPTEGIIATVIDELKHAGKGKEPKPTTKDEIIGVLKQKFGKEHAIEKMMTTVNNLIPGRINRCYALKVLKAKVNDTETGYYILPDKK